MATSVQEQAARAVVQQIAKGRDAVIQIGLSKLAEIAALHGLANDLPPVATSGMEQLWRERLLRELGGRTWKVGGRLWRVRCPWGGNFRLEPVTRRGKR